MSMKRQAGQPAREAGAPAFFSTDVAEARRFYLDLDPPRDQDLVVVCGGVEHCTSDYAIDRASFPFFSIEYVVRGRGQVKLRDRAFPLQPGRVFAYGPGVSHHITGDGADPLVKYFADFAGTQALPLLRSCRLASARVLQVFPPNTLQGLFEEFIQSGSQGQRDSAALCAKLLECLVLKIGRAQAPLEGAETLAFTTYQQCRQHIDHHFLRLRTLEQIAAECHVNNAYLCRLFRRYEHQSPYQYLLRLKMNFAAERLKQAGALVKQVAEEVGFADPFHFSRVFKVVLGLSPAAFRRLR